jgi:hypothetical protein
MAHSFLVFEFGGNEESAQQARHRIEGWKQGFRLDKKLQVKFERTELEKGAQEEEAAKAVKAPKTAKSQAKAGGKKASGADSHHADDGAPVDGNSTDGNSQIRLIVRLDFSEHEKLSHTRWLERIPGEEPFKTANPKVIRAADPDFKAISTLFDSLD